MRREEIEHHARLIWSKALGVEVNDDTDFFDAGGHSFLALQIIAELDAAYGTGLPLRVVYENWRFDDFVAAVISEMSA